jgi:hypothetical protein
MIWVRFAAALVAMAAGVAALVVAIVLVHQTVG